MLKYILDYNLPHSIRAGGIDYLCVNWPSTRPTKQVSWYVGQPGNYLRSSDSLSLSSFLSNILEVYILLQMSLRGEILKR